MVPGRRAARRCSRRCTCRRPVPTSTVARPRPTTRATPVSRCSATPSTRRATVGTWLGDGADAAVDAGLRFLDATTGLGVRRRSAALRTTVRRRPSPPCARSSRELADALARTPAGHAGARRRRHRATFRRHRHRRLQRRRARCRRHRWVRAPRDGRRRDQQLRAGVGPRADRRARREGARVPRRRGRGPLLLVRRRRRRVHRGRHPRPDRGRGPPTRGAAPRRCSASSPAARSTSSPIRRVGSSSTCSCRHVYRRGRPDAAAARQRGHPVVPARGGAAGHRRTADPRHDARARRARRDRGGLDAPAAEQPRGAASWPRARRCSTTCGTRASRALRLHHDRRHRGRRRPGHQHLGAGRHRDRGRGQQPERAQRDRARARRARARCGPRWRADRHRASASSPRCAARWPRWSSAGFEHEFGDGAAAILGGAG